GRAGESAERPGGPRGARLAPEPLRRRARRGPYRARHFLVRGNVDGMIYLIGAGGHGKVVLEALLLLGCDVELLDADGALEGSRVLGRTVVREEKALASLEAPADFFAAVG